jgi:hypothetical protein
VNRTALLLVTALLAVGATAGVAHAQGQSPFGPLPPAAPEQTPTPAPADSGSSLGDDVSQNTLVIVLGGLVILFVGIGWFITRDARNALPEDRRREVMDDRLREEGAHKHPKQAKAKSRAKTKAQKRARRANRPMR